MSLVKLTTATSKDFHTETDSYSGAIFSGCKTYRYSLWRKWDMKGKFIFFIGLNPSRGNEHYNDPTIKRLIAFAKSWGYGGLYLGNLFAIRSPEPQLVFEDLSRAEGIWCNSYLQAMVKESLTVVYCWGSWPKIDERVKKVTHLIPMGKCFGVNSDGQPKHPLYLKSNTTLEFFKR